MAKNYFTYDVTHKDTQSQPKIFFLLNLFRVWTAL